MIIGSVLENKNDERRVAITPDIVKKYKSLGIDIHLTKDYASHLGISDKEYEIEGANIFESDEKVISNSDVIVQMSLLNDNNLEKLKKDQILIGVLNSYLNEKKLKELTLRNIITGFYVLEKMNYKIIIDLGKYGFFTEKKEIMKTLSTIKHTDKESEIKINKHSEKLNKKYALSVLVSKDKVIFQNEYFN